MEKFLDLTRIETFDKCIKMIESSTELIHLKHCKNYFELYNVWFFVLEDKKQLFEKKLELKYVELEKKLKNCNKKNVKKNYIIVLK